MTISSKIKYTVRIIIWSVLGLYGTLLILLNIPLVQKKLSALASQELSSLLRTEVSVGHLDVGLLNRVIIQDVSLKDQQGNPLLKVAKLSAKFEYLPLLKGKLLINSVQLFSFNINLQKDSLHSVPNYQFVLDALASKDTVKKENHLNLRINSVLIRRGNLSYDVNEVAPTPNRFNPSHLQINNLTATVSLKALQKDSINAHIKRFSMTEHSGLAIKKLNLRFIANTRQAAIENFQLALPNSSLNAKNIEIRYDSLEALSPVADHVSMKAHLKMNLTPSDLAPLVPVLTHIDRTINADLLASVQGKEFEMKHLYLEDSDHLYFQGTGVIKNWSESEKMKIDTRITSFTISPEGFDYLYQLPEFKHIPVLNSLGYLRMDGSLKGSLNSLSTQVKICTGAGDLAANGTLHVNQNKARSYTGKLEGSNVNVGTLINNTEEFGMANFQLEVKGLEYTDKYPETHAKGVISSFEFRKYNYENITLDGIYKDGGFSGNLLLDDDNAKIHLTGSFNTVLQSPVYNLQATVKDFSPNKLNLSDKYEDKSLSFSLLADFTGKDFNDINGCIQLDKLTMMHRDSIDYQLEKLNIHAENTSGHNAIKVESPFLNADVSGNFHFYTIPNTVTRILQRYLPALVHTQKEQKAEQGNNFQFEAELKDATFFNKLLYIPLEMHMPAKLKGYIHTTERNLQIVGNFPRFSYDGKLYDSGVIQCANTQDQLNLMARGSLLLKSGAMLNLSMNTQIKDNQLKTMFNWGNNTNVTYGGNLSATTRLSQTEGKKPLLKADIDIHPSTLVLNDTLWQIHPSHIAVDSGRVFVDRFLIERPDQSLLVDGRVGKAGTDSCNIDMKNIQVEYILDIVRFDDVLFGGRASGRTTLKQILHEPSIRTRLDVKGFTVNKALLGRADIKGVWDKTIEGIRIDADIRENDSTRTTILGYVSPKHKELDLHIGAQRTNLCLIHPFIDGIFNKMSGYGTGNVRLFGDFKHLDLEGGLRANLEANIEILHTGFKILNDSVSMVPGQFLFNNIHIADYEGNTGIVNGYVHHNKLKNIMYNFNIDSKNLLMYNTKEPDEMPFYGKVYTNGDITLRGGNNAMNIDALFSTAENTSFTYVNGMTTEASNNQFITFVDKSPKRVRDEVKTQIYHYSDAAEKEEDEGPPMDLHINMMIDATPQATMKVVMDPLSGDAITATGNGNLKVNYYNKGDFRMFGNYIIDHGMYKLSMQEVIRKDFTLQSGGMITFAGDPYQANLDLQAIYTVNSASLSDLTTDASLSQSTVKVNCIMNIGGNLASPTLKFDLDLPAVSEEDKELVRNATSTEEQLNTQIIYLLGIGKFYAYDYDTNRNQSNATSSLAFNTLSGQLNNILSQWMENKNWNLGANLSTGEKGWTDVEAQAMLSGRLLNNRLLVNGNFGYRENAMANTNFVGDFEAIWLLTKNGDFRLRGYNQTNDRYFTKSTLTTQGIGFIYKKDFNRWSDLFNWMFHKNKKVKKLPIPVPENPAKLEMRQEEGELPIARKKREESAQPQAESFITFSAKEE